MKKLIKLFKQGYRLARRVKRLGFKKVVALFLGKHPRYSALELERAILAGKRRSGLMKLPKTKHLAAAVSERRYVIPEFVFHSAYAPPSKDVVFASVCNDKYVPGLEALILSLLQVYPQCKSRYIVFHDDGLSKFSRQRLLKLYSHLEFRQENPNEFNISMGDHYNHVRVGRLGYLALHCIKIVEPDYLVILDTDLLILGDISVLWSGDLVQAAPDIGIAPFGIVSKISKKPILNSGVISLPKKARGPAAWEKAKQVLAKVNNDTEKDIEMFADQRFWNIYLRDEPIRQLPQNFNTIKTLVQREFTEEIGNVQILHFTGPKPWYDFTHRELLSDDDRDRYSKDRQEYRETFALWDNSYRRNLYRVRMHDFIKDTALLYSQLEDSAKGRPCVMIGNGPSINKSDLSTFNGYIKFGFNWFINHPQFDEVKVDHLVLASHMLFGGWMNLRPELPGEYIDALLQNKHMPRLWVSYYFKDYVESIPELKKYQKGYFFLEKPFKRSIAQRGIPELDIRKPLVDCNTGVLTAGIPLAVHLGSKDVVLVGCDSNYSSSAGSYFYKASAHKSKTTRQNTLLRTWKYGGEGHFGYDVTMRGLERLGIKLFDATIDGALVGLPCIAIEDAPNLLSGEGT